MTEDSPCYHRPVLVLDDVVLRFQPADSLCAKYCHGMWVSYSPPRSPLQRPSTIPRELFAAKLTETLVLEMLR